mmetsp:Transcript_24905/g.52152  ORF Transcript_24905/g.52152 Transcript_24905/m.52152 type:complete len:203 (+) Transcript_24905:491-1099(+)
MHIRPLPLRVTHQPLHGRQILPLTLAIHHVRHVRALDLRPPAPSVNAHHGHSDRPRGPPYRDVHVRIVRLDELALLAARDDSKEVGLEVVREFASFALVEERPDVILALLEGLRLVLPHGGAFDRVRTAGEVVLPLTHEGFEVAVNSLGFVVQLFFGQGRGGSGGRRRRRYRRRSAPIGGGIGIVVGILFEEYVAGPVRAFQ